MQSRQADLVQAALKGKMNIGNLSISPTGHVFYGVELIGTAVRFEFRCAGPVRSGHLSIRPCECSLAPEALASHLAHNGLSLSIDIYGEFWPNSYVRDGHWFFEAAPGEIVPLNIAAQKPQEEEEHFDACLTGVY